MESMLGQLGIGAVLAVIIIREFLAYLRSKNEVSKQDLRNDIHEVKELCDWLKEVHDRKDDDGVFSWYVRKSLQDQVQRLADSITSLNTSMSDIHHTQKRQTDVLEKMFEKLK